MKLKKKAKKWKNKKKDFLSIFLLRPLLETNRFDLKKICQIWKLPVYPDLTNQKLTSTRNRIRLQLLPILRFFFNPQIDTIFTQFSQINLQEQDYLNSLTTRLIKDLFSKKRILQNKTFHFLPHTFLLCKNVSGRVQTTPKDFSSQKKAFIYRMKGKVFKKLAFGESEAPSILYTKCTTVSLIHLPSKHKELFPFTLNVLNFTQNQESEESLVKAPEDQIYKNFYQTNPTFCSKIDINFHVLYKFEFKNQPFFFIPLAIQKRIGKTLVEYFLNKKINFLHVEQLMKYLKDSQNLV